MADHPSQIPLLRNSYAFSSRLIAAGKCFGEPKYYYYRRVNWSYRYDTKYYEQEARLFAQCPRSYIDGKTNQVSELSDIYALKLSKKNVLTIFLKVTAHWLFRILGNFSFNRTKTNSNEIFRKCYVDDVEKIYDPEQINVIRFVFPFPLSLKRQLKYFAYLHSQKFTFQLCGNPYIFSDLIRLAIRRDLRSLVRLESRAQILQARYTTKSGFRSFQLSDEYDIGSLDFCRYLTRYGADVVNSAHGVGTYFPIHAYTSFYVLTKRQQEFYRAIRRCAYNLRQLNDFSLFGSSANVREPIQGQSGITVVFLNQAIQGLDDSYLVEREKRLLIQIGKALSENDRIKLYFKPHPNNLKTLPPAGFEKITKIDTVNGKVGTVFASYYSTCQIDPTFKGRKCLISDDFIFPEILFDETEEILSVDSFVGLVKDMANHI